MALVTKLTNIGDAIRNKTGKSDALTLTEMVAEINSIQVGSGESPQPSVEQATPSITVSSSGLITASATQDAGNVSAGTKTATKQLATQAAKTVTPSASSQIAVETGMYTTGTVTVAGDSNLKAGNIKKGAKIFGVTGTYEAASVGGAVYPDGAFAPVSEFTDGKQYALVAVIDGSLRYINTSTYNNYTMNATQVSISEDAGSYVVFNTTPALFTAVASGNGFMLQNGTNYLHGTTTSGTALRVGTTQAVWTTDTSATGGFSSGKYYTKENEKAVWLFCNDGTYDWSIKYETAGSFGYDRNGRDNTYSTGFTSFVLYEYVAGENGSSSGPSGSGVDTSDATAYANDILDGKTAYARGELITGTIASKTDSNVTVSGATVTVPSGYYSSQVTKSVATATQVTPTINVSNTGLITASSTQSAGYVSSGTKSATQQLTTQAAKTVTPSASSQTAVASGVYTTGAVTVSGDANLIGANIISGKSIFGVAGTHVCSGGGSGSGSTVYPDGAFVPVSKFTDGKQYALIAVIDGSMRYVNTTAYNNYTQTATAIAISEDAGNYVIFSSTPVMFTAVESGNGFMLQNGSNYLHGTTSNGTALRVGATQAIWTVDTSATGGFSSGKYYEKEDSNSVWLFCNDGTYDWSIKYETAGSFGYDRSGRDNTYSTGFTSFILYEYVAGESAGSSSDGGIDTSDATAKASDIAKGVTAYVKGEKITGTVPSTSEMYFEDDPLTIVDNGSWLKIETPESAQDFILKKGGIVAGYINVDSATFGTATAADVAAGKTFTAAGGFKAVGTASTSGGSVIKTGTTTSSTIATGLSSIESFFIYKESQTATGLIHLSYSKTGGTSYLYASAWSTNNYGTKTITNATNAAAVNGGSITLPSSTATSGGLSSGVTYKWVAVGSE